MVQRRTVVFLPHQTVWPPIPALELCHWVGEERYLSLMVVVGQQVKIHPGSESSRVPRSLVDGLVLAMVVELCLSYADFSEEVQAITVVLFAREEAKDSLVPVVSV